jgi:hypothetical protein
VVSAVVDAVKETVFEGGIERVVNEVADSVALATEFVANTAVVELVVVEAVERVVFVAESVPASSCPFLWKHPHRPNLRQSLERSTTKSGISMPPST